MRFLARVAFALLPLLASGLACSREPGPTAPRAVPESSGPKVELLVYAATSTRDALQAIEKDYEREHAVDLVFNFGSSGDLSNQIVAAAQADVFLSADEKEMDEVEAAKLVAGGSRRPLLSNQLVVVEPADGPSSFTSPFEPGQLAGPKIKLLSLGNPETVPAGRYAKAWLEKRGAWSAVSERILPGVDVRAALAAVESAGAQAGIVYRTDLAHSKRVRLVHSVPMAEGPKISYPIAVLSGRPHEKEARAFTGFLASSGARQAFESVGFVFLPAESGNQ